MSGMDNTPVTIAVKLMFYLRYAIILWSVLLANCRSQSHASMAMLETDNACTEEGSLCPLTGKFLFSDTRCWVTCRRQIRGRRERVMVMMEVVGASSYCHVISGPVPGLYKCDKDGQWRTAKPGGEIRPLKRVKKFWRRRRRSPPPNSHPRFTKCPSDIEVYAPVNQKTAVVIYTVAATDDSGYPSVTQTAGHGYRSGSTFNEGLTHIQYTARDSGGLTATCNINIKVLVRRCSDLPVLSHFPHGSQTCNGIEKRIYGSSCQHSCHAGYVLQGSQTVICQSNSAWSTNFPSCQPVSCGDPGVVAGGDVLCAQGHVYPQSCDLQCRPGFQVTGVTSITCQDTGQWSSQFSCQDIEAPKFPNGCPADQQIYSGPLESPVPVTWSDPVTSDNSGAHVTLSSTLAKGSLKGIGVYNVNITATDTAGNSKICSFVITVESRKCTILLPPANGQVSCSHNNVEGSECTMTCNLGYRLKGAATLHCLNTQLWNVSEPTCEAIICPSPAVQHGAFQCPSGFQHPATCNLTCSAGFQVVQPSSIECFENATWSTFGSCRDVQPPQFPNGCPTDIGMYAAPFGTDTVVSWTPPDVTDNSGNVISLQSDVIPGASFPPGVTNVTYVASDATGNTETCQFSVEITVLSCDDPKNGLSESDSQSTIYTCPNGHVYGTRCTVTCVPTYVLVGDDSLVCEQDNSTHPPTMTWQTLTGFPVQSVCRASLCPALRLPENGALSCHLGDKGMDCLMSCHEDFSVPYPFDGFFYCTNAGGNWVPSVVPNCVRSIMPSLIQSTTTLFYFTGNCSTSPDELRQTFVTRLSNSRYKDACIFSPLCIADNVEVTCGPVTSVRGKREADDVHQQDSSALHTAHRLTKRESSSHYYLVTVITTVPYKEDGFTPEQVYEKFTSNHKLLQQQLLADVREGHLDVGDLVAEESGLTSPKLHVNCPPGTMSRPLDPVTRRFSCVGCSKGFYLPVNATQCLQCPIGFYTELDNATSCTPCPPWWSNPTPASQHSSQCPP